MLRDISYARLCQSTYDAPEPSLTTGLGRNSNFAYSSANIDELHTLCFRGSKSQRDWLLDLFAFPLFDLRTVSHAGLGPLHAGFLVGATSLLPQVSAAVGDRPYALCGHSLGGALATLIAALLAQDGNPPVEVVTFGAPRVGMDLFVDALQHVTIRQYCYGFDPVPHVPTHPPFTHPSPILQLGKGLDGLMSNHHLTAYLDALEKYHEPPLAGPVPVAG